MSTENASLFAQNRDEVMTPILPAGQNGPVQGAQVNLGATFGRAANDPNYQQPQQQNTVQGPTAQAPSKEEGQRIANDAIGVGQNLQDAPQGMQMKQSDAVYLGKQMLQGLSQVGGGLLGILSDEHKGNQPKGPAPEDDNKQKLAVAPLPQQFNMHSPSPGFGGGPGG